MKKFISVNEAKRICIKNIEQLVQDQGIKLQKTKGVSIVINADSLQACDGDRHQVLQSICKYCCSEGYDANIESCSSSSIGCVVIRHLEQNYKLSTRTKNIDGIYVRIVAKHEDNKERSKDNDVREISVGVIAAAIYTAVINNIEITKDNILKIADDVIANPRKYNIFCNKDKLNKVWYWIRRSDGKDNKYSITYNCAHNIVNLIGIDDFGKLQFHHKTKTTTNIRYQGVSYCNDIKHCDKWNPSDVFYIPEDFKIPKCNNIYEYNKFIDDNVYCISLKESEYCYLGKGSLRKISQIVCGIRMTPLKDFNTNVDRLFLNDVYKLLDKLSKLDANNLITISMNKDDYTLEQIVESLYNKLDLSKNYTSSVLMAIVFIINAFGYPHKECCKKLLHSYLYATSQLRSSCNYYKVSGDKCEYIDNTIDKLNTWNLDINSIDISLYGRTSTVINAIINGEMYSLEIRSYGSKGNSDDVTLSVKRLTSPYKAPKYKRTCLVKEWVNIA